MGKQNKEKAYRLGKRSTPTPTAYKAAINGRAIVDVPGASNLDHLIVPDQLILLDGLGGQHHVLQNRFMFLLVSHALHIRGGGVENIHAWPDCTFQPRSVGFDVLAIKHGIVDEKVGCLRGFWKRVDASSSVV